MQLQLSHIVQLINGKSINKISDIEIHNITIDSRSVAINNNHTLFFCIKGERHNGHDYIGELYNKSIRTFVIDENIETSHFPKAHFIKVKNTLIALQLLAQSIRKSFDGNVLAITGSNGKTIVKEWLFQLMHEKKTIVRSPKSYNSQVGVPLSLLQLNNNFDWAIIEAGISKVDEMQKLQNIIQPNEGMLTNIGKAHLENFKNAEQLANEKWKLFAGCKTIFCCIDNLLIKKIAAKEKGRIISWSKKDKRAELFVSTIKKGHQQTDISCVFHKKNFSFSISFTDDASIENALHCCLYLLYHDFDIDYIRKKMLQLSPVAMRLEQKKGINHCTIINDSYNSDIVSLSIALDYLLQQHQHKKRTVILSDILQSGIKPDILYKEIAKLLKEKKTDRLIAIGSGISIQKNIFPKNTLFFENTQAFLNKFPLSEFNDEAILIKGARDFSFEKISYLLEQKTHETKLEVNLTALVHNFNYFKSLLKHKTKIMAMVKAFSYGAGSFEIANALEYNHVDYLAVAYTDEGVSLRKAGIRTPIMVMNPEPESFEILLKYRLEPEIFTLNNLKLFIDAVRNNAENNSAEIHIKIDSGMHRLGFQDSDISLLISELRANGNIKVKSIFSHLAASDEPKNKRFTQKQIQSFSKTAKSIEKAIGYKTIKHILNTNGILYFPEAQFDMVRLGIGLYGIAAKNNKNLEEVNRLTSVISQIRKVKKGETIGYSRAGKAERDMRIAVVSIGYADGFFRILGNGNCKVKINGKNVPTVGNICMDMCMIDITDIACKEGDEVVIFDSKESLYQMSKDAQTIPYEILTSVSERVKRIFYWGEK